MTTHVFGPFPKVVTECDKGPYLNDVRKFFFTFGAPSSLSAFGTDMQYIIHATSLTTSAFWGPPYQCGSDVEEWPLCLYRDEI